MTGGSLSPAGDSHPGAISHDDWVSDRHWIADAADVPQGVAWVQVDDAWLPVVSIEVTGEPDRRRITSFGEGRTFLASTIQSPPTESRNHDSGCS